MIKNIYMRFMTYLQYIKDYLTFARQSKAGTVRFALKWQDRYPCLTDRVGTTAFDRHYTYHPAWAARILAQTRPEKHIDIGSILHFSTLVSAFIPVTFYDYRPAEIELTSLTSKTADLLSLPFENGSIHSLSCMHVVEHVGLGRYGDPLDPDGDRKAIAELKRVLAPGGLLLFVVPIGGTSKIMFNAHRIYRYDLIIDIFSDLDLVEFALIPDRTDQGGLVRNPPAELVDVQEYGCGCFCFRKRVT